MINMDETDFSMLISGLTAFVVVMISVIYYLSKKENEEHNSQSRRCSVQDLSDNDHNICVGNGKSVKSRKNDQWKTKVKDASYDHSWSITTLKGHTSNVTGIDFAPDGRKFVSVSIDRTVFLWNTRDFSEREHKSVRQVLDYDTATKVVFAPDSKSLVFSVKRDNKLSVYKLVKKEGGGSYKFVRVENVDFPSPHTLDISAIGISSTGKYLMSASPDMKIVLYDIRGEILKVLEPKVSSLFDCVLSADGRFVAICGFTPDVFVYEICFSRDGNFQDAKKVFDLKGHNSGVFSVAFNQNCSRAITVSRDGWWRVFDTDIRYTQGQEAVILCKGEWNPLKGASPDRVRLACSPSGGSFAVSFGSTLKVFSSEDEHKDFKELPEVHFDRIHDISYSSCGKMIATAGDRHIRVFHNVPEYHSQIIRLSKALPEVTGEAPRRRIQEQIEEAREMLRKFI